METPDKHQKELLKSTEAVDSKILHVYKRRWLMLFLLSCISLTNGFQWLHLNIIGDVVLNYYNASMPESVFQRETALDWLSMLHMIVYIVLIVPSTWLLDKKGLRVVIICGSLFNALGAWIKVACVSQDRFALLIFAQTICALSPIFTLGIPARLAAVWFGPNQVSTATSIGVFGSQVGLAVGCALPPLMVPQSDDMDSIGRHLDTMFYMGAVITTLIFIFVIVAFEEEPQHPPSKAQWLAVNNAVNPHYKESTLMLLKGTAFSLLLLTYGINIAVNLSFTTLLNPVILHYFPGHRMEAGLIGLTFIAAGFPGAIMSGIFLDKTKMFKCATVGIYVLSAAAMTIYTSLLQLSLLWVVFLCTGILGFFMNGYVAVGFELAAEITYPVSAGTSSALLVTSAQVFGIIFIIGMRAMMDKVSIFGANITLSSFLLFGMILTAFIGVNLKRQSAEREICSKIDHIEFDVDLLKNEKIHIAEKKKTYTK